MVSKTFEADLILEKIQNYDYKNDYYENDLKRHQELWEKASRLSAYGKDEGVTKLLEKNIANSDLIDIFEVLFLNMAIRNPNSADEEDRTKISSNFKSFLSVFGVLVAHCKSTLLVNKISRSKILSCIVNEVLYDRNNMMESQSCYEWGSKWLMFCVNVLRNFSDAKFQFRQVNGMKMCLKFLRKPDLKILAIILMAYSINMETSGKMVQLSDEDVEYMLKNLLDGALKTGEGKWSWLVEDYLLCFAKLSSHEPNALKFVNNGCLDRLDSVLATDFTRFEVESALKFLRNLCAYKDNVTKIKILCPGIADKVKNFQKHAHLEVVDAAKGVLWFLERDTFKQLIDDKSKLNSEHILISCHPNDKSFANLIAENLMSLEYEVQLSTKKEKGQKLEDMVSSVLESYLVITCHSESHVNSTYCGMENAFAVEMGKPIVWAMPESQFALSGSLALSELSICFYPVDQTFGSGYEWSKFFEYIESLGVKSAPEATSEEAIEVSWKNWKPEDVMKWWVSIGIKQEPNEDAKKIDGDALNELKEIQKLDPAMFSSTIKRFNFSSLGDEMRFTKVLLELELN